MIVRHHLSTEYARRYRTATRAEKGRLLDEFCTTTGYNRKYAIHLLTRWGKSRYVHTGTELLRLKAGSWPKRPKRVGHPRYGAELQPSLLTLWTLFDSMCGKRLKVAIADNLEYLRQAVELGLQADHLQQIAAMSPATLDRRLKAQRAKERLKGIGHTKPTTSLKRRIPVRTFAEWDRVGPGHFQIDTVGHDGANSRGQFCFTLAAVDVASFWTELRALLNRARRWVVEALTDIHAQLPFPIHSANADSGGEFINFAFADCCRTLHIELTRSRPNRHNDNCYIECRNDDAVRRLVGYTRFEGEAQRQALQEVYRYACLLMNYFHPSMKLLSKQRQGAKVVKKHDTPKTPYQRLLDSPEISPQVKARLQATRAALNLVQLKLACDEALDRLMRLTDATQQREVQTVGPAPSLG